MDRTIKKEEIKERGRERGREKPVLERDDLLMLVFFCLSASYFILN